MKTLRILFTCISALFIAAVLPIGAIFSWAWAGVCAVGAFIFYFLMLFCKQKQEEMEEKKKSTLPQQEDSTQNEETKND